MNTATPAPRPSSPSESESRRYQGPFALMTVLFFMWGFMTVWNDILIPRFKEAFTLTYFQAMLVQFAFFGAYTVGSLIYFVISMSSGDPINRIGYKNGVILGLLISAAGSALFYPAATLASYPFFLGALFIVGLGFAMLQIAANPYVTILGPERTASSRLNLSQAFNSFGTTIGPLIAGWLIFKVFTSADAHGADSVKIPYLICAVVFVLLAVLFRFAHLPDFTNTEVVARDMGAFALSDMASAAKRALIAVVPVVALVVIAFTGGVDTAKACAPFMALLLLAFFVGAASPQRMLALFSLIIIGLLAAGVLLQGGAAMWTVIAVGMFCSVMWSNIFSLAIEGLGPLKSQASSLLVMAICGGALLPLIQGALADRVSLQVSFVVPMVAFAYTAFYGVWGYRAGRQQ